MSRTLILLLLLLALVVGGVVWSLTRSRPNELEVAAKDLPPLPPLKFAAADWPWWRGPASNGQSPATEAPLTWSETENVVWKTAVAGRGHSSPIVVGERVFLTSADEGAPRQFAICLDRAKGSILWEKTVHEKKTLPHKHGDNSHASTTPACDGERLFVAFANEGAVHVTALDMSGEIIWQREAGPHAMGGNCHGYGSSPALWGPFVIVSDDSPMEGKGWIAAIHRGSGEIAWRQPRKTGIGSYGSPIVAEFDGKPLVLLAGNGKITAYNPADGTVVWDRFGMAEVSGNTVAASPTMVFGSSGFPKRKLLALKADGSVAWQKEGNDVPYPPSMLYAGGVLYVLSDQGLVSCFDAQTGKQKWKERTSGSCYASPLLAGENIYICNREGLTTVFKASPDGYSELAKNKLDKGINASPVAVGGRLYIRTETHLYCLGK